MKINDAVIGAVLLLLSAGLLLHVQSFPRIPGQDVGPGMFPGLIAVGLAICGALLIGKGLRQRGRWAQPGPWVRSRRHAVAAAAVVGGTVVYILLADIVGFLLLAPVLFFVLFWSFGTRPMPAAIWAVVVTAGVHYAFYQLLRVPLPWGVLTPWAW